MGIRQDLPHTSQSKSWCGDGEVYCRGWFVHILGLRFQLCVGPIVENTQIVFISESLNDFTPGVNIMAAPQRVVSIEVTCDKHLASNVPDQMRQISDGEVVVAWDVHQKDSDSITQSDLDGGYLEMRVNPNRLDVDRDSSTWKLVRIPPQRLLIAVHSWHTGSDSRVERALILFPVGIQPQADAHLLRYQNPFCYTSDPWSSIAVLWQPLWFG